MTDVAFFRRLKSRIKGIPFSAAKQYFFVDVKNHLSEMPFKALLIENWCPSGKNSRARTWCPCVVTKPLFSRRHRPKRVRCREAFLAIFLIAVFVTDFNELRRLRS